MNSKAIFSGAFILFLGNLLSSLLGLTREVLSASYYGASVDMDSYIFAYALPSMILFFVSGFLTVGFIPMFIKKRVHSSKEETSLYLSNMLNVFMLAMILVMAICYVFSDSIAGFFAVNEVAKVKIETMLWILLPSIFFFGLSFVQASILNALNHFKVTAFLTVVNNLSVIFFIIVFQHVWGIYTVAIGFLIGTVVQVLIQLPALKKVGVRYRFYLRLRDEDLKRILIICIPIMGLVIIDNCVLLATRYFSTQLDAGSASALNYANRIILLPITLFGTALVTASYPSAILMQTEKKKAEYNQIVTTSLKSLLLILMPIMFISIVYAPHIIKILLERGAFDAKATTMTATSVMLLSIGIVLSPIKDFINKLFFSKEIMKTPIFSSLIYFSVFIGVCLILVPSIHYMGIAIASSSALLSSILYLIIRYNMLEHESRIHISLKYFSKILFASASSVAISYFIFVNGMKFVRFQHEWIILTLFCIAFSLLIYIVFIKLLKIQEIDYVAAKLLSKYKIFRRKGKQTNENTAY
jgi:putative peptidoglycan lipid II flippase